MDKVQQVLNLEPTPNDMPAHTTGWLTRAKAQLQEHFDCRVGNIPIYDRSVSV